MFIYTVRPGDSLYGIGSAFGISTDQIRLTNGLTETNIVPGQALLIPLYTYTVQYGDNFYSIADRSFVSAALLRQANPHIAPAAMRPGMKITIPDTPKKPITALGYYGLRSPQLDQELINDFAPYATYLAFFEYHFSNDGSLNDINDLPAVQTAWRRRVPPLMTVTNLTETGFSSALAHQVLNRPAARSNLIANIAATISRKGYAGVNIDFENISAEDRDLFTGFLRELKGRLQPSGYVVTIAVPPKTSEDIAWLRGYDYGGIGSVVDLMFIMAYDWHHGASEPGPVAPINEVRQTIQFALSRVPKHKIILGFPLYGYNWTLPYQPGATYPGISNHDAIQLAMRHQTRIQYAKEYESPFFEYTDEQGKRHVVWFEDSRSIGKKMLLMREYDLDGGGVWQLTLHFPQGTWLLTKFFRVRKV
ncbi:glycosyl hydrolase family 18 protein [Bacillus sonorensis]|uniref:Sporulation-specific glycosylase YdhD n=2 Tax=Bacillus sonorensis TaxID=119858 RepID=M5PB10_9BACI|nr:MULTISPECIES: glycosyl hydrolase family 18 protein [Bacillus]TWK84135.1 putative sporulation-specific glycosylase YdhD [Bacillus paralicheniformis]ASB89454.1 N-acetylmuramoyl-L-alanine amidase [Bacillus sonorensis]EME72570.1 sporulation-specific glycosylase YdhD [Bacillus sonorensis L12]MBG9915171.1 sporulation protein [Bacillus sonorensis]MCY7858954.1 glycosyl hydrolase family 18 protein [Bacillus sonorensis]